MNTGPLTCSSTHELKKNICNGLSTFAQNVQNRSLPNFEQLLRLSNNFE
jgi:hypothetical protein